MQISVCRDHCKCFLHISRWYSEHDRHKEENVLAAIQIHILHSHLIHCHIKMIIKTTFNLQCFVVMCFLFGKR